MIFSTKSLIWTAGTALIGFFIYLIFKSIGLNTVGLIFLVLCAGIGFVIGTFKVPESTNFKVCRQTAGENLDDIIIRAIKFKLKKNKIYVYAKEEKDNVAK